MASPLSRLPLPGRPDTRGNQGIRGRRGARALWPVAGVVALLAVALVVAAVGPTNRQGAGGSASTFGAGESDPAGSSATVQWPGTCDPATAATRAGVVASPSGPPSIATQVAAARAIVAIAAQRTLVSPASSPLATGSANVPPRASSAAARVYRHGPRNERVVALTFDDGYSSTATLQILAILQSEHVAATFFPYGWAVNRNAAAWKRVAAAGYPIGNHTQAHKNLATLSMHDAIDQLVSARKTIERVTGQPMIPIVRPPYGGYTAATTRAAVAAGFDTIVLWDVDTRDWSGIPASTIAARAEVGTNGSIVLMHAGPSATPHALRAIIHSYRSRGFTFVTVPELLGIAP